MHLVGLGKAGTDEHALAETLYERAASSSAWTSSTTTATSGPGGKFADAELLGVPLRLTVGKRTIEAGEIEAQVRRGRETRSVPLEGAAQAAKDLWATLP